MNIYLLLRKLAKTTKAQNLFIASKEIGGIRLFRNSYDFSKLQEIYLSHLYNYDSINRDIIVDHISPHILDSEIYEDAYLLFKRKNIKKRDKRDSGKKDVNLVVGKAIKFPTKELK